MNLALDPRSAMPLHAQAEEVLRRLLREPAYRKGGLLPDEVGLARRMGISRNTLRMAIERLVRDGLLERKRGVGTRVREASMSTNLTEWSSFTREMERQGIAVETFRLSAGRMRIPVDAARALEVPPRSSQLCLDRLRGYHGQPVVHFRSWLHPRLGLTGKENFQRPLYEVIEEVTGITPLLSSETIQALPAAHPECDWLEVAPGTPLLVRGRRVCDASGRPIEYAVNHYRGDRFTYRIDIRKDRS